MSGEVELPLPVPVSADASEVSELELAEVGLSAPLASLPVRAVASPRSEERLVPLAPAGELPSPGVEAPPAVPSPTADCVLIASVRSDAKSAPVVGLEPEAGAAAPGAAIAPTCCSIAWMCAWIAAIPEKVIRV
jgi:hypothetical protein